MNKAIFKKFWLPSILCIAMISLLLPFPMPCHGQVEPCTIGVEVSPYQVNIDAGGVDHYVRVLTYARYSNTDAAFVYIDENEDPIDSEYIELKEDSFGNLVIYIDLIAIQDAGLEVDTYHDLKIVVELIDPADGKCEGTGEIYIIGKKSDTKR